MRLTPNGWEFVDYSGLVKQIGLLVAYIYIKHHEWFQ
ncbi:MAG: hypothetical protein JWM16_4331 [Verrucomicrobiales bacterium]|nr:hypothetical protein [Verrucomicrobiales bacterium]